MGLRILTVDIECTSSNKGNPFDVTNRALMIGIKKQGEKGICYDLTDGINWIPIIQEYIDEADMLVGFNIKFDLHWLQNKGILFEGKRVFDCQIAEFLLSNQREKYPSLNGALTRLSLPLKLNVVKEEYWDEGRDTSEVPVDILEEYLLGDLIGTEEVYKKQTNELVDAGLYKLFKLQCLDLCVLQKMEYNGIIFNTKKAREKADEISKELSNLVSSLNDYTNGISVNLNSGDHVSCLLYGGLIEEDIRIPIGEYKTGEKIGQTRYKILTKQYNLPRLITPLKGTERLKKGDTKDTARYWQTNDDVIRSLKPDKGAKKLLDLLKKYTTLEKLRGTYLIGWSNLLEEMNWEKDIIHGNLNQCVASTGRLTSTKPNLQNADPQTKIYCESRYDNTSRC